MWGESVLFYRESSQKRKSSLAEMVFEQRPEGGWGKHTMQIFGERAFEVEETGTKASWRSVFGMSNRLLGDQYV